MRLPVPPREQSKAGQSARPIPSVNQKMPEFSFTATNRQQKNPKTNAGQTKIRMVGVHLHDYAT